MNDMMSRVSPGATAFIRMDHTHALAAFHRYRLDAKPEKKQAVADTLCLALEIHARLEEEIFYPAMRSFAPDLVDKSIPEHNEMRRLIAQLRQTRPQDQAFDMTLLELMRDVMRHVADEETMLLPDAERVLGERRLAELGAAMMRRRFELAAPHAGDIAIGDRVFHDKFGYGAVLGQEGNKLEIAFDSGSTKRVIDSFVKPA